ncbi:copper homeostasis membrane protein CopD [Erwinia sp. S43]|uniref:copper homeostasis membrane protein CopD n=1 Tax=Erwinia sp. S43 TaxID=2769339 RepID=UPI00190B8800|nr:copper homeostasis membrane protein CopD [Erwinia sp. S43]MBK0031664.1 copper homeostasis membrane protein CopD [Erwinia sp. S43]
MSLTGFYIFCRWLHFGALMSLAGAGIFTTLLAPARYRARLSDRFRPLIQISCWLTLFTTLLLLSAQTGLMGDGWRDMINADVWAAVLQTGFGRVWQLQCVLAMLGCLTLLLQGRLRQQMMLLCALLQLAGLAFVGHAAILDGWLGALQRGNQIVHLLAAAFWAGGLWPVALLMREARNATWRYEAIKTMMRYSRYGHLAVALAIISGVFAALLLLGWPLVSFRLYSQLLLLKTLLVAAMVAIALFNRYWLVPRFQRSGEGAQHNFVIATLVEVALAALALLSVSLFATLEPA